MTLISISGFTIQSVNVLKQLVDKYGKLLIMDSLQRKKVSIPVYSHVNMKINLKATNAMFMCDLTKVKKTHPLPFLGKKGKSTTDTNPILMPVWFYRSND